AGVLSEERDRGVVGCAGADVGDGDLEQLERQRGTTAVACHEGDDGGEVASGGLAANPGTRRVNVEPAGVPRRPQQRCVTVFGWGREPVLGCESVLDGRD